MGKTTYSQYQRIIRKGAWKKFSKKHGIVDIITSAVCAILVALFSLYVLRNGIEFVLNALATLVLFFVVYSLCYLVYYFSDEHVTTYNSKQDRIDQLVNKWESYIVDIKLIPKTHLFLSNKEAGIRIDNIELKRIDELTIRITALDWIKLDNNIGKNILETIDPSKRTIKILKRTILPTEPQTFYEIAEICENGEFVLLLNDDLIIEDYEQVGKSTDEIFSQRAMIDIHLEVDGLFDNRPIRTIQYWGKINFIREITNRLFIDGNGRNIHHLHKRIRFILNKHHQSGKFCNVILKKEPFYHFVDIHQCFLLS